VLALSYNHERFVERALDSILVMDYPNIQLLIADDHSKDKSQAVIEAWVKKNKVNCQYLPHKKNIGLCASINELLPLIDGKYLQFLACDDYHYPHKLKLHSTFLEANPQYSLVCGNFKLVDADNKVIKSQYFSEDYQFPENTFEAILTGYGNKGIVIHSPTALVKVKSIQENIGQWPEDIIQEDFFAWLSITAKGKVAFINNIVTEYRYLANSMSNTLLKGVDRIKYLSDHLTVLTRLKPKLNGQQQAIVDLDEVKRLLKLANALLEVQQELEKQEFFLKFEDVKKEIRLRLKNINHLDFRKRYARLLIRSVKQRLSLDLADKEYLNYLSPKLKLLYPYLKFRAALNLRAKWK
jgi:glycosyltransferase involved in cell wall biosynthesis